MKKQKKKGKIQKQENREEKTYDENDEVPSQKSWIINKENDINGKRRKKEKKCMEYRRKEKTEEEERRQRIIMKTMKKRESKM